MQSIAITSAVAVTACALFGASVAAHANTVFDITGTGQNTSGGTLGTCASSAVCSFSGTVTIDTTTGSVVAIDVKFPGLASFNSSGAYNPNGVTGDLTANSSEGNVFFLLFPQPGPDLTGFQNSPILFGEAEANNLIAYNAISGSISGAPLPAALPLFASGLGALGLLGWRRKRKAA